MIKRLLAGFLIATSLASGTVVVTAVAAQADTGWPCPGC